MEVVFIAVIVFYAIYKFVKKYMKEEKPKEPPTEDVKWEGCRPGYCDYYIPEIIEGANGDFDVVQGVGYCGYKKIKVKHGCKCPLAEEHPERLRKSMWLDD